MKFPEVDCGSSEAVEAFLARRGPWALGLLLVARAMEIVSRLWVVALLTLLTLVAASGCRGADCARIRVPHAALAAAMVLVPDYAATAAALACGEGCELLAPLVALPAMAANVVEFADRPARWAPAARRAARRLARLRRTELALAVGLAVLALAGALPGLPRSLRIERPPDVGRVLERLAAAPLRLLAGGALCALVHCGLACALRRALRRECTAGSLGRAIEAFCTRLPDLLSFATFSAPDFPGFS